MFAMKYLSIINMLAAITACCCFTMSAFANESGVTFGSPAGSFKGTGCHDQESQGFIAGANTSKLTIQFEGYDAGKRRPSLSGLSRSSCYFSLPIIVPSGYRILQITTAWEGYVEGKGQLERKFYLSGAPWKGWMKNNLQNKRGKDFIVKDHLRHDSFTFDCNGGQYSMRIASHLKASGEKSYVVMDNQSDFNGITLTATFKKC